MSTIEFGSFKDNKDRVNNEDLSKSVVDAPTIEVPIWVLEEIQDALRQTQNYRDEVRTSKETSLDRSVERAKNLVDNLLKYHCGE